jgi:AraC family transcriptional regulator
VSTTIAPESLAAERHLPSRRLDSSDALGWRSVLVRAYADPDEADGFTTAPTPDLLVVINASGTFTIESRGARGTARARYRPGSAGVTAPLRRATLSWRRERSEPRRSVHIFLSAPLLQETAEALGRPQLVHALPDALLLDDPVVSTLGMALSDASRRGADPVEGDSLAQALALHVLFGRLLGAPAPVPARPFDAVIEFMHEHRGEPITLEDLAAVAALSKFHFLRQFTEATGLTPHRYLTRLRVQRAAEALRTTGVPIGAVARANGYASPGQFARAFRRQLGVTPTSYRSATRGARTARTGDDTR